MTKVWNDINQSQFKVDLTHFDGLNIFGYSSEIQNRCELVMVYGIRGIWSLHRIYNAVAQFIDWYCSTEYVLRLNLLWDPNQIQCSVTSFDWLPPFYKLTGALNAPDS